MMPLVPIIKDLVQQFFTAKEIFDKKQNELGQLISKVTSLLEQVEYFDNIEEDLFSNEQKQIISNGKDLLHNSEQLLKQLPSNLTLYNGFIYSKSNDYKEMLQNIDQLKMIYDKLNELEQLSLQSLNTMIIPNQKIDLIQQTQIYQIHVILKLQAPKNIKQIFDQYPIHLRSQYDITLKMADTEPNKDIVSFSRNQFLKLQQLLKETKIYTLSKSKHCTLEMKNPLHFNDPQRLAMNSENKSEINSQENQQQVQNNKKLPKLFLVVKGKNGIRVIRNQRIAQYISKGEEYELLEKDQIVILQDSDQQPLVSYNVKRLLIQQL